MQLASINNLSALLYSKAKFREMEGLVRRSLNLHSRLKGPEDPETLSTCSSLAASLHAQVRAWACVCVCVLLLVTVLLSCSGTTSCVSTDVLPKLGGSASVGLSART